MRKRALIDISLLLIFLSSFQPQARRIRFAEEVPLTLSSLPKYEIGSDGIAEIDGKKVLFPPIFGGHYKLYQIGDKEFILVAPNEVAEFIVDLKDEEEEIVDTIGSGLMRALPEGADRLQWAENFLEDHSPFEVKMKLKEAFEDLPDVLEEIEAISEEDLYRLTRIANKFGLFRVVNYFSTIRSYPEEANNPTFFRDALFYLLEGVPNPETALEDFEPSNPTQTAFRTTQNPLPRNYLHRVVSILGRVREIAEALSIDSRGNSQGLIASNPRLNVLQRALAKDIIEGFRVAVQRLKSSAFSSRLKQFSFPLGILDEIGQIMDLLIDYSRGNLEHLYRVYPFPSANTASGVVISDLSGNFHEINPPAGAIFWQHPDYKDEIVGVVSKDSSGNKQVELFLLEGGNLNPLNPVTSFQGDETWDRTFYLGENGKPDLIGKLWVRSRFRGGSSFSWQDSDFGFSFAYAPRPGESNSTPLQLRIEYGRVAQRMDLDLGGPRLSTFLNNIMGDLQQQFPNHRDRWRSHHFELEAFKRQLQQIGNSREERILLEQLLYLLLPLESGTFTLSRALVVVSLQLA